VNVELARVGATVGAAGLAALLVAPHRHLRLAGLAGIAVGGVLLVGYLAPGGSGKLLAAAAVLGIPLAAAGAVLFRRYPWLLPIAALLCVPARMPVTVGDTDANLLLPLYGVIAAAGLALAWSLWRGEGGARELGPMTWPLAALVAVQGLSLWWSDDPRQGAITLVFFVLPFGVLSVCIARLPWRREPLRNVYLLLGAMALVFAGVGVFQWVTRDVFWNPKVIVGNAYAPFYRVNSVFWDPSIYGRFLVIAILASLVLILGGIARRIAVGAAVLIGLVWFGLLFSFSQSSFAALMVGTFAAAAFVWRWRAAAAVALAGVVLLSAGMAAPSVRHSMFDASEKGLDRASSGRFGLITDGAKIAADNPITGVGIGGFKRAYAERTGLRGEEPKKAASHNTPVTVAAELGFAGLVLLLWLVGAALLAAFRRAGPGFEGLAALVFAVTLGAIAVHSLFYDAFFEDPMTWALLALIALVTATSTREATP
jgi:putative inorganic carbon (HCO3(-)) transporter